MHLTSFQSCIYIFIVLMVLSQGCTSHDMGDFNPDRIESLSEERLKYYSDTSLIIPKLLILSNEHQQLDSLIYYAEWLKKYNEGISLFYAEQAYDLATEKNWNFPRAISAYQIASIKDQKAKYGEDIENALVDARISDRLMKVYKNNNWNVRINILFGQLFLRKPNIDSSRYYFETALQNIINLKNDSITLNEQKAFVFHGLGSTYMDENNQEAINYFKKSQEFYEIINNEEGLAHLRLDLARVFERQQNYSKADSLYDLCVNFGKKVNDNDILTLSYQGKGILNFYKFYENSEPVYFNKTIENLKQSLIFEYDNHSSTYGFLGAAFHKKWDLTKNKSYADSAVYYHSLAINEASNEGTPAYLSYSSQTLSILCADQNVINCDSILGKKVLTFINDNYMALVDTITLHSKGAYQRINKVEQRDIQVSAANKRKSQLYISLGILMLAITAFLFLYQRQQNRRLKAEMDALRAQINPHFISNSLNAIESLVNLGNAKAAAKYLVHFSRLSRRILNGSRSANTSLGEELKTLEHFLALEQLRFRDKLTYEVQVEENVNEELIQVPAMILQPYVENAIWHGIKPKADGGKVSINIRKEGKVLICAIEDNGVGRKKSTALRDASVLKHKSMGMQITEERLKAMGKVKGSQVEIQDLEDDLGNSLGTKVIVKFPIKLKKHEKA